MPRHESSKDGFAFKLGYYVLGPLSFVVGLGLVAWGIAWVVLTALGFW